MDRSSIFANKKKEDDFLLFANNDNKPIVDTLNLEEFSQNDIQNFNQEISEENNQVFEQENREKNKTNNNDLSQNLKNNEIFNENNNQDLNNGEEFSVDKFEKNQNNLFLEESEVPNTDIVNFLDNDSENSTNNIEDISNTAEKIKIDFLSENKEIDLIKQDVEDELIYNKSKEENNENEEKETDFNQLEKEEELEKYQKTTDINEIENNEVYDNTLSNTFDDVDNKLEEQTIESNLNEIEEPALENDDLKTIGVNLSNDHTSDNKDELTSNFESEDKNVEENSNYENFENNNIENQQIVGLGTTNEEPLELELKKEEEIIDNLNLKNEDTLNLNNNLEEKDTDNNEIDDLVNNTDDYGQNDGDDCGFGITGSNEFDININELETINDDFESEIRKVEQKLEEQRKIAAGENDENTENNLELKPLADDDNLNDIVNLNADNIEEYLKSNGKRVCDIKNSDEESQIKKETNEIKKENTDIDKYSDGILSDFKLNNDLWKELNLSEDLKSKIENRVKIEVKSFFKDNFISAIDKIIK